MKLTITHKAAALLAGLLSMQAGAVQAVELIIGEERIAPGIVIIFEGAVKDKVTPGTLHLPEKQTDVHIEARVNWDTRNIPEGTPPGGFVPYLDITAQVENEKTGAVVFVDLLPHINLIDSFHYARNMALPGKITDPYKVSFTVLPPAGRTLALHRDWSAKYGAFASEHRFTYEKVDFEEIARATR